MMFRCTLIERNGAWRLAYNQLQVGPYTDQVCAMEAAMRLTALVSRAGGESEVVLYPEKALRPVLWLGPET
jgi:hypothetical protein